MHWRILFLPLPSPSFTVSDFKNIEQFLDRLPTDDGNVYAVEFRHPSWGTEGPWEMLKHYNIATPSTDRVYVANSQDNTVYVIDGRRNTVIHTINVGNAPDGVSVNPSTERAFVANSGPHD